MSSGWRIYLAGGEFVSAALGDHGGSIELGTIENAVALAERIRHEFTPDSGGPPGAVRIRQSWRISAEPHAVVVLHVQAPHLTAYELGGLRDVVERIEVVAERIRRRLELDAEAGG